jgi:hypothetical protein
MLFSSQISVSRPIVAFFDVVFPHEITMTAFRLVYGGSSETDSGVRYERPKKWFVRSNSCGRVGDVIYQNDGDQFATSMIQLFHLPKPVVVKSLRFQLEEVTDGDTNRFAVKMLEIYGGY